MWRFAAERAFCSKPEAGAWALSHAPELDVIEKAIARYRSERAGPLDEGQLAELLARVRAAVGGGR
jgi:hypothetical protein